MMHGHEKSDFAIVAMKPANKAEQPAAEQSAAEPTATEPVERRAETKGNAGQQSTHRTQSWVSVSQALERIRQASAVMTRGRSRMRESCMYGSVRGAPSNGRPYRDRPYAVCGKAACTDLCGGRPVTGVPTATGAISSKLSAVWRPGRSPQQPGMPVVGFLNVASSDTFGHLAQAAPAKRP